MNQVAAGPGSAAKFEEFYKRYDYLVKQILRKQGVQDIEDAAQEVWTAFYAGGYMDHYDSSVGSASNYIWHFTTLRARGYRGKQHREPCVNALSLVSESDEFVMGEIDETRSEDLSTTDSVDFYMMVQSIREAIAKLPLRGKRDLSRLFNLMMLGYDQKEISAIMQLSEGTISNCVTDLRRLREVRQLLQA